MTKAEKHFEALKDTSFPLPIWYQNGLIKQWKSRKLILQGKGYTCISPGGSNELIWFPLRKIQPKGAPSVQTRDETTKIPRGRNYNTIQGSFKNFQKMPYLMSLIL